ncbi:MAG TPA: hypothetical protein VN833_17235 [Candidatus Acidoferrales bacterium]|jgi:hypothetical protein|nr:hypothetical protein [Candidatus Acidoferrales bacterium]
MRLVSGRTDLIGLAFDDAAQICPQNVPGKTLRELGRARRGERYYR